MKPMPIIREAGRRLAIGVLRLSANGVLAAHLREMKPDYGDRVEVTGSGPFIFGTNRLPPRKNDVIWLSVHGPSANDQAKA